MNKKKKKKSSKLSVRELPPHICVLGAICIVLAVVTGISAIVMAHREPKVEFIPPEFEPSVIMGMPEVSDDVGYTRLYQEGMAYAAYICGVVTNDGGEAVVYFTNPEENNVWIKLRISDDNGNIIGESGLLKPGEYIRSVPLNVEVTTGATLKMRIMGYEPDTYMSMGSVNINTVMQ